MKKVMIKTKAHLCVNPEGDLEVWRQAPSGGWQANFAEIDGAITPDPYKLYSYGDDDSPLIFHMNHGPKFWGREIVEAPLEEQEK